MNAVAVAYSVEEYPNGLIITGSNDQTIAIHNIESNELIAQLHEHAGAGKCHLSEVFVLTFARFVYLLICLFGLHNLISKVGINVFKEIIKLPLI